MNSKNVLRMAQEAGISESHAQGMQGFLERFAALVAEHERNACVQIIEEYRISGGNSLAGELAREWTYGALKEIRDDIRARGNT